MVAFLFPLCYLHISKPLQFTQDGWLLHCNAHTLCLRISLNKIFLPITLKYDFIETDTKDMRKIMVG